VRARLTVVRAGAVWDIGCAAFPLAESTLANTIENVMREIYGGTS
jgi:hypothetical protein